MVQVSTDIDVYVIDRGRLYSSLDVSVADGISVGAGLDLLIHDAYQIALDVSIFDGGPWDAAAQSKSEYLSPVLLLASESIWCILLGTPTTRYYYIDSNGLPIESPLNVVPAGSQPKAVTITNFWSEVDRSVHVLVCDRNLARAIADYGQDPYGKPLTITNTGKSERFHEDVYTVEARAASSVSESDWAIANGAKLLDLEAIDIILVALL